MKKVLLHITGILTAVFFVFLLGLFIGRQQLPSETIPTTAVPNNVTIEENTAKVNINTASIDDLCTLPGIGAITAEAIIDYREEHGQFESVEQLLDIKGIGNKKFENIIDYISIE